MSVQKVIATEYIEQGSPVVIQNGLARPALEGIHTKPEGRAVTAVAKGELATFNPDTRELRRVPAPPKFRRRRR